MRTRGMFLLCALLGGHAGSSVAQEALVLSGGGARGLAHAGVFEGLQELGYDPDIVVGTSMGAVLGAMYAAGYEPAEIRERLLAIDWSAIFTPTPVIVGPERTIRYPMVNFALDVQQLRVAHGFVGQWRINRALAGLLFDANARARGDFDRLARRYRAVAADLKTGEAVVLHEGDLARAARASMSVPGFFAPVRWGEHVLVDGGIVNNLPTGVARELGARRVIAVDVARPPEEIPSLSPLAVVSRALDLIQENTQRDPIPPDALVLPEIEPAFTGLSFPNDPRPLFQLGLEAARQELPRSAPRTVAREHPLPLPPDSLHELELEAADSALAALARTIFAGVAPGPYDPDAVLEVMDRLYTTGLFEAIWPRVVEHPDTGVAAPILVVRLDSPPRTSLSAAAGYENDRGGRAWASLDHYSRLGRRPTVLMASASLNGLERWASLGARVFPLSRPALAWSLGAHLSERDVRLFRDDALSNTDVVRIGGWAGLEFPHVLQDRTTTTALRAEWIHEEEGQSGFSAGPLIRFASLSPEILVVGTPFLLEGESRWGPVSYGKLTLRGSRAFDVRSLLLAGVADLRMTSANAPGDVLPALGDEHAIPGLQWGERRGRSRAVLGVDAAYPVKGAFIRLRLRSGAISQRAEPWKSAERVSGLQVGALWRSPVATVEWGVGANTGGNPRFDFSIGRHF